AAVRESPLLALRPHSYRLRHRQLGAFWVGLVVILLGMAMSVGGSYLWSLAAIIVFFLGLALMMPHAVLMAALLVRPLVGKIFGFEGFLAADNLRKGPQRTAFNVIALGGALSIMVATAALIEGFTKTIHDWIRVSLPLDISISSADMGT